MSAVWSGGLGHEDAEAGRRLGEPVDLGLQRDDLIAGLAQRCGEAFVVGCGRPRIGARVGQPPFQHGDVVRVGGRALPHPLELFAQQRQRRLTVVGTVGRCHRTPPRRKTLPALPSRTGVILAIRAGGRPTLAAAGATTPGASRRAKIKKPVWPTIACWGRTASPSACQPRTSDSVASGSVKPGVHPDRLHRAGQLGGGGHVRAEHPARHQHLGGRRRRTPRAPACRASTRSTSPGGSGCQPLDQVAHPQIPGRDGAGRGSSPRSCARWRRSRPAARTRSADRSARSHAAARWSALPSPTPASITRAPGKMSAPPTIWAASLG